MVLYETDLVFNFYTETHLLLSLVALNTHDLELFYMCMYWVSK